MKIYSEYDHSPKINSERTRSIRPIKSAFLKNTFPSNNISKDHALSTRNFQTHRETPKHTQKTTKENTSPHNQLMNKTDGFTSNEFRKHLSGINTITRIYDKEEYKKIENLALTNYLKEASRPQTVFNQRKNLSTKIQINEKLPENTTSKEQIKYQKINVYPINKNSALKERVASANTYKRVFNLGSQFDRDNILKKANIEYKKECEFIAKEIRHKRRILGLEKDSKNNQYDSLFNITSKPHQNESDIFNLKTKDEGILSGNQNNTYKVNQRIKHSVILMDEETAKSKGNEVTLLQNSKNKPINICTESKSNWRGDENKTKDVGILNHVSTTYNPISSTLKNFGYTKEEVLKANSYKPFYKPKIMSDFIDKNRNGAPNKNTTFRTVLQDDEGSFKKTKTIISNYYDIYNQYKNVCEKPFQK